MELQKLIDELRATNLCTYFILPLTGVNKLRFGGEANFLNSFLSMDGSLIYVEVYQPEFVVDALLPEHRTCIDGNGKDYFELKVPEKFREDVILFMEGKYSEMSDTVKRIIREDSTLDNQVLKGTTRQTDVRLLALDKSSVLREYWESQLWDWSAQSHINDEMELLSKPDEFSYLTVPLTYT